MIDFSNVSELFVAGKEAHNLYINGSKVWEKGGSSDALTFTAEQANSTISMYHGSSSPILNLEYSTDNGATWQSFIPGTTSVTLANVGDTMRLRATEQGNERFSTNSGLAYNNYFNMSGRVAASGSILYLLRKDGVLESALPSYCFTHLFRGASVLSQAPELPSTLLGQNCYEGLFNGCQFTEGPYLPATTLAPYCYYWMFENCRLTSVKIAYTGNFSGSGVPSNAFSSWMQNVTTTGTLYYNGSDRSKGTSAIPSKWTVQSF